MRILPLAGLILALVAGPLAAAEPAARAPYEADVDPRSSHPLDALVGAALARRGLPSARVCSDEVFVRRVHLDVIGTLPEPAVVETFLRNTRPDKRAVLIDQLLARDEFADYWAMKWCDLLRVKSEFPINLWPNAVQAYHRWIRDAIRGGLPYDRFVRELLTASGSNFRVPQVNFYRAVQSREPTALAEAAALAFMGTRLDRWPEDKRKQMGVFFSRVAYKQTGEWKEEIVCLDPAPAGPIEAVLPDGTRVHIAPDQDPRAVFADWLIAPRNAWFTRNIANRTWAWLMGRGVIHEPDDIRPDNPPANSELLARLEQELLRSRYDLKALFRLILNSQTYQQSSMARSDHPDAAAMFASYPVRRLEAEVLIDALCGLFGGGENYTSPIPEPFTFIPDDQRTIALADGSITSPFLEMFGRPARDTGLESERNNQPTDAQRLHLLNSSHVQGRIERSQRLRRWVDANRREPAGLVRILYLNILSRPPTPTELNAALAYVRTSGLRLDQAAVDLAWALVNSKEFLYRH